MIVVVLAATPLEAGRLAAAQVPGLDVEVIVTGIGMVNAAHALTVRLLRDPAPALVIQTGIGGAFPDSGLAVGRVALASEEIYGELGVMTPSGWEPVDTFGFPVIPARGPHPALFNRLPLDAALVARARAAAGDAVASGPFLTQSQVTGVTALGAALFARFGACVESMEGAAAAHVCLLHDCPFLEVRGISNLVEDRNRAAWRVPEAAAAAQQVTLRLIEQAGALLAST